ncbi:hypothetical protein ABZ070_00495 [Streptomyces sp. NPDC006283]|uniref:hypothetical protein n=1 Tax=Streptomyces sp. NPDC006283 TaxID=3156741 RepID=UPI0033AB75D9
MIELIEVLAAAAAAALVGRLVLRRRRQRAALVDAGEEAGIPCMLKRSTGGSRWRPGRLLIGTGPLAWQASWGGRRSALPAGLRRTGVRAPSMREALGINPGSRIVECEAADEVILIAVMPQELDHVLKAVDSA